MAEKSFTYAEVSAHTTKKSLHMVIHDKVYDVSSFVDEHPYVQIAVALHGHDILTNIVQRW
jgi:cytochrome b involved in lipid metabolism